MDTESMHIGETPHTSVNSSERSCHDTLDSGYLTFTPNSSYNTVAVSSYRTRSSGGSAKRFRLDPWQCEKRQHSKLSHLLNVSESDYLVSEQDSALEPSCTSVHKNLGLVHSTPSCINDGFGRVPRIRNKRNWRTMVPITPASTDLQLLSPPPSPAVPTSSYIASEPVQENEKLLVRSRESTSEITSSPRFKLLVPRIIISPVRRKICSPAITSAENQQLSKLSIADLASKPEIKPKRLDFSYRGLSTGRLRQSRPTPSYTGREKVDFLSLLGEESNHLDLVSKILSWLEPQDLCAISMVSTTWRRICRNDVCANRRRMSHILCRQNVKENLKITKKAKQEEDIQMSPKSRYYVRKGCLLDVQNLLNVPLQPRPPNSPPVSPSKVKFHSFVKASRTLAHGEYLLPCPRCTFPCHVDSEKNVGTCSRQGCSIEFCTFCSSKPHTGPCKTPLLATPTKRNKQRLIVGSRQSKRNLRRL